MKKIYIAGAGGMLGEAFYQVFKNDYNLLCTDIEIDDDWITYLDFRDYKQYRKDVIKFSPDYLFHFYPALLERLQNSGFQVTVFTRERTFGAFLP